MTVSDFAAPKRWGWVLIASAVWTLYVWITRIFIIADQNQTRGFKIVHFVLAGISIAFAIAVGTIGVRLVRKR